MAYLFHHESPKRPPDHLSQRIVRAAQRIHDGSSEILDIGDLRVEKEWTFAGDVVDGMLALLEQDAAFEAVIGSGETHSIQEWVSTCFALVGLDWTNMSGREKGLFPNTPVSVPIPHASVRWGGDRASALLNWPQ